MWISDSKTLEEKFEFDKKWEMGNEIKDVADGQLNLPPWNEKYKSNMNGTEYKIILHQTRNLCISPSTDKINRKANITTIKYTLIDVVKKDTEDSKYNIKIAIQNNRLFNPNSYRRSFQTFWIGLEKLLQTKISSRIILF